MNITILNIVNSTKNAKNGKPYQVAEVSYKNNTFGGKIEGFKVTSYMKAYGDVITLSYNDTVEVGVEKKNGFNEWVSVQKAAPSTGASNTPARTNASAIPRTSTSETAEERARKQVYIVRQSSIASAISLLTSGAKSAPKVSEVIATAKQLEGYVFENNTGFDDIPDLDASFLAADPQIE